MIKEREITAGWDYVLLLSTLVLVGTGLVMVYSASSFVAEEKFGEAAYFFRHQIIFAFIGLTAMLILKHTPYQLFCRFWYFWLGLALAGLGLVFVPGLGHKVSGASRWINLGIFRGQPSEFAKFALVVFLAYSLAARREVIKDFSRGLLPHLAVLALTAGLIVVEPDLGAAVTLALITIIMLFVAGARFIYLFGLFCLFLPVLVVLIMTKDYRMDRIFAFRSPWEDPLNTGYHIIHSFYAFGSGGLTGAGPGAGRQKLFFLPEPHTDFIFSVIGEELGFIGVAAISLFFLILIWRGVVIALNAIDLQGSYLALGLTLIIGLQAFMNMYVVVGLLPTKGLALPLMSYGGSSLIMNLVCIGVLMNIAAQSRRV